MKFIFCFVFAVILINQVFSQTVDKPGKCPAPRFTQNDCSIRRFAFQCNYDTDCKGTNKCCNNGCVGECVAPIKSRKRRSGTCPVPPLTLEDCKIPQISLCNDENICPVNQMCCPNGCGAKKCMTPQDIILPCKTKPGVCPQPTAVCKRSQCKSDCDCPGSSKCCNGCLCTQPGPVATLG